MQFFHRARSLRNNKQGNSRRSEVSGSIAYSSTALAAATLALGVIAQSETADAVPSFARQTGYYCSTCHTAQPELTPFGRQFKLNGYTQGGTRCGDIRKIFGNVDTSPEWSGANLSMWVLPDFNHLSRAIPQASLPNPSFPSNNIFDFSDASMFFNGQIYCNLGIFSQYSYTSTGSPQGTGQIFLDNSELRYTGRMNVAGNDVLWGVLGNNTPGLQDVWNTMPAWNFPWVPVDVGIFPLTGTMIEGTFAQRAYSAGAYVWINSMFYAELTAYRAQEAGMQKATGFNWKDGTPRIDGAAPYWRLAVEKTWNEQSIMFGTYGMAANLMPTTSGSVDINGNPLPGADGLLVSPGLTDKVVDVAVDAQYQYIGPIHAFTARAYMIWERSQIDATFANALPNVIVPNTGPGAQHIDQWQTSFNASASYIYDRHVSFTFDYFNAQTSFDNVLYGASNYSRGNNDGVMLDLAYIPYPYGGPDLWPWLNARMGILYTHWFEFNGGSTAYNNDGTPLRNAKDNDQVFLYSWIDF